MELPLMIGWQEERAELRAEVSHMQDELAESRADREELESRVQALTDRLTQTLEPSLPQLFINEQKEWQNKLRYGRERESRQAILIQKLQSKVLDYRARFQALQQQTISGKREMRMREKVLRDERSDTLESTLIRLEEEQQRSLGLSEVSVLLRSQLSHSTEANEELKDDLRKLTFDWSKAVEELVEKDIELQKEKENLTGLVGKEQTRLMTLWGRVVTLRRQCHSLKTATDKDLWELRAEFSRLCSSLLARTSNLESSRTHFTTTQPLSSSQGPMSLDDLEQEKRVQDSSELRAIFESESLELRNRITELNETIKTLQSGREKQDAEMERRHKEEMERKHEEERKWEQRIELERNYESVRHAVRTLSGVLSSQQLSGQSILPVGDASSEDLSSVLSVIAQAESTLHWRQQEIQDAQISFRQLGSEKESLDKRIKLLESEKVDLQEKTIQGELQIKHTQQLLNSEKDAVNSLQSQLKAAEKLSSELKQENEHVTQQRAKEEEKRIQMESERQKCVEAEMLQIAQLSERETHTRLELYSLKGALEREKLDRARAEQEAADKNDSLLKAQESFSALSTRQTQLERDLAEGQDALKKMAILNEALSKDKQELSVRVLQLETELAVYQNQIQTLDSELVRLRREIKTVMIEADELRITELKETIKTLQSGREKKEAEMERRHKEEMERKHEEERKWEQRIELERNYESVRHAVRTLSGVLSSQQLSGQSILPVGDASSEDLSSVLSVIAQAESTLHWRQQEIQDAHISLHQLGSEKESLDQRIKLLESEKVVLQEKTNQGELQIKHTQQLLNSEKDEVNSLKSQLDDGEKLLSELKQENEHVKQQRAKEEENRIQTESGMQKRITELKETIKTLQSGREKQEAEMERRHKEEMERKHEEERKWEQRIELERNYESVRHAVRTLSVVLSSQQLSGQSILPVGDASSEDLSSVLSVIAQAESTLHWRQQEIQDAHISLRRLGSEKESLEQRIKLLESEKVDLGEKTNQGELQIKHTQQLLNSEKDVVNSLQSQLKEAEKLLSELKQENEHVTQQRAKEEEKRIQMESERQKRITELKETIKTLQSGREKQEAEMERRQKEEMERKHEDERKWEQRTELERNYESVRHAVRTLSGVLSSQQLSGQSILPVGDASSEDLSSVLSVIAQAESTLHWRQQEIQDAHIISNQLGSEKESLEQKIKLLESEKVDLQEKTNQGELQIKHTEELLNSEKDEVNSLKSQLEEAEKLLSELKQENEHVTQQRAKEEEKRIQMECERQKRITELKETIKTLQSGREMQEAEMERRQKEEMERKHEEERKWEQRIELERNYESVRHAVRTLSVVLSSQQLSGQSILPVGDASSEDLSSVLSVIAQAESTLHWRQQEIQDAHISLRRLGSDKESLEQRIKLLESEKVDLQEKTNQGALKIKHTEQLLNSEKDEGNILQSQLKEAEKLLSELKQENEHVTQQRAKEEEKRIQMESERQKRITELKETIKTLQSGREMQEAEMERRHKEEMERKHEEDRKWKQRIELERNYKSVRHAVRTLSGVLSSQQLSGQSILPVGDTSSEDLSSVLSVIAQAESTLHWRQQEIQDAQISLRRLGSEKESLEQRIKLLESEKVDLQEKTNQGELQIKHTEQLLNSEKDAVNILQSQLKDAEKLLSELKQENEHVTQQRAKEEEKRIQMESERQKRVEAEMLEIAQLSERETHTRLELYSLKGALEREKLDRARAEQEAADKNDSLLKAQESFSALSTRQAQLERDLAEGQDALKNMAILNEALSKDKQELSVRVLQLETELAVYQNQIQTLDSELVRLRREIKTVMLEADELREQREADVKKLQLLQNRTSELEMERGYVEHVLEGNVINGELNVKFTQTCSNKMTEVQSMFQDDLDAADEFNDQQRCEITVCALQRKNEQLTMDSEELRYSETSCHMTALFRGLVESQQQQEVHCSQLDSQGQFQSTRTELIGESSQRENENQEASEERIDNKRKKDNQKHSGIEHEFLRFMEWQKEQEALNSELKQKDGNTQRNKTDGLDRQEEMLHATQIPHTELENLHAKLETERNSPDNEQRERYTEMDRWTHEEIESLSEYGESFQSFGDQEKEEFQNQKIPEREHDASNLLQKLVEGFQNREEDIEELKSKFQSFERKNENLQIELQKKHSLESRIEALEQQNTYLKETKCVNKRENVGREEQIDELKTLEEKNEELVNLERRDENWVTTKMTSLLKKEDDEEEYYEPKCRVQSLELSVKKLETEAEYKNIQINLLTKENLELKNMAKDKQHKFGQLQADQNELEKHLKKEIEDLNYNIERVFKEKEMALAMVEQKVQEMKELQDDFIREKSIFEEKIKAEHAGTSKLRAEMVEIKSEQKRREEREEDRRKRCEFDEKERERRLREELFQKESQSKQLKQKIQELEEMIEEDTRARLKQVEDIKQQMVFLQASQEQTRALKKTLEEREAENQRLLHHMETMNQLQDSLHDAKRRSEELAKSLEETECAFEKAKQQCREKEDYLADFNREIIVVKHERDQEKAMVAELSTEVQLLRDKLDKRLEDVNRLSQVLQDTQTQVQILETKVMSCVQEKEHLLISLRQIEAQKNHLETQLQDEKQESERLIPALQMFKPNQKPSVVDSGHGTLSDVLEVNSDYRFQNNEINIVREKLKRKEQETEILRSRAQSLQSEIDTLHAAIRIGSVDSMPLDNEKSLKEQLSTALLFNEERDNLLKEKDAEVYELKARTEELIMDRDRVRIALEKTESTLIEYMEQQEQLDGRKVKLGPHLPQYIKDLNPANEDTDFAVQERLSAMQRAVAHLEEENDTVLKRNYHLEIKNEKLKTETNDLRQTLKEVEQKRQKLIKRQRLSQSEEGMLLFDLTNNTHKEELKRAQDHAKELQEQVQRLQHERAVFHQQKAAFIDQSLKNNESVMSLRRDLTESLATVSQQLSPAVLDSESRKLDRSIRMEEYRFSLNK